jgi:uncharacterized protein with GYD domain
MARYLYLGQFTDPQTGPAKLMAESEAVIEKLADMGVICLQQWVTFSAFDVVVEVEAESPLAVQKSVLFASENYGIRATILSCLDFAEGFEAVGPERLERWAPAPEATSGR